MCHLQGKPRGGDERFGETGSGVRGCTGEVRRPAGKATLREGRQRTCRDTGSAVGSTQGVQVAAGQQSQVTRACGPHEEPCGGVPWRIGEQEVTVCLPEGPS